MAECNCGTGGLPIIKQGDAYAVQVSLTFNGEPIVYSDLDLIEEIEFTFGELAPMRFKPKSIYNTTIGAFLVPLTQEQTFMLEDGKILVDCRVQFWGGDVVGVSRMVRVFVREALSWEILPEKPYHEITPPAPGDVLVLPLTITANGTYTAPSGKAYSPVTVNVPQGSGDVVRASWHQCPEEVRHYLANVTYSPSDYSTSQIANYAPAVAVAANAKPIGYTTGGVTYYNEEPNVQTPFANEQTAGTLEPLDRLRWINCPTVNNVRDLGGWACDGGTVKYGMLFRGGEPTAQDAAVLVDECGVKFEMNLRGRPEANREYSILGNIGYAVFDTYAWYSIADTTLWRQMMRAVFDAINNSIPVYFHCAAGLDRTGTFACILEALLGMSQSDCDKEYELSCFSTGTDTDQHARRRDEADWRGLINQINAKEGSTFRDKVVNFVLSLGFSISEINRFRAVMIDGTPEILVGTNYTVTNALTGVTNSNAAQSAEEYQPYVATLTPNSGKLIDSVTVTMGGTDITSQVFSGTAATRKVSVTQNLTYCVSSYAKETADADTAFTATLTADTGYTLDSVTIMMGGTDVSQYYSNGTINIPSVTGNIVITATAVETAKENLLTMNDGLINKRLNSSAAEVNMDGYFITDYFAFDYASAHGLRIVDGVPNIGGTGTTTTYGDNKIACYDANKNVLGIWYLSRDASGAVMQFTVDGNDLVKADLAQDHGTSGGSFPGVSDWSTVKFIRLCLSLNNAASAIGSVSDVLNSGMKIYAE